MLDLKSLRDNPEKIAAKLANRGYEFPVAIFLDLEQQRKQLQIATENLQNDRNQTSKEIGMAKARGDSVEDLKDKVNSFAQELKNKQQKLSEIQEQMEHLLHTVPNIPQDSVPIGSSEADNVLVREYGSKPKLSFSAKAHYELSEGLAKSDINFTQAANLSGARFSVLHGQIATMHRALGQYMLDLHITSHGYQEVNVPFLVKSDALFGTAQFPKFVEDQFGLANDDLWLIPTAEVPVTNLVRETLLKEDELPLKFAAWTPCFRREAGSYGKDMHGIFRQHQFEKVELVQIVAEEKSDNALEELCLHAEQVLKNLDLHYKVMELCTADLGFGAAKTYDLEVWLPSQANYREISSCSNYQSFQARRMKSRYKNKSGKTLPVHTINGSGLAIGRTLIAILENYQDEGGRIAIPSVLQKYMGNKTHLE